MSRIGARDFAELLLLSVFWGSAYLFMRSAVPAFGPAPLVMLRLAIAVVVLLPVLLAQHETAQLREHGWALAVLGVPLTGLPFLLLGLAATSLGAGKMAILNATSPLFAALFGHLFMRDRLAGRRALGLALGFSGVVVLVWGRPGTGGDSLLGVAFVLASATLWGVGGYWSRTRLAGVSSVAQSVGSLAAASLALAPLAIATWPLEPPGLRAWLEVIFLGVLSSGVGMLMYFRLLRRIGPVGAISVTFLNPPVSMISAVLYLGEAVTLQMLAGCAVILAGTALTLGLVGGPRRERAGA